MDQRNVITSPEQAESMLKLLLKWAEGGKGDQHVAVLLRRSLVRMSMKRRALLH